MTEELLKKAVRLADRIEALKHGLRCLNEIPGELARSVANKQNRLLDEGQIWALDLKPEDFAPLVEKKRLELQNELAKAQQEFTDLKE